MLKYLADRENASAGDPVGWSATDPDSLAHSESLNAGQIDVLLEHLESNGWLKVTRTLDETQCIVTVVGHNHLAGLDRNPTTKQVFVAMWFDDSMLDAYRNGIEPGIRDAGFVPHRIDEKKDADKIDDDIIAEIRKSRFVVADMTHGRDGLRGSVYFEAGFARGHGLGVVYSCRKDCVGGLPFDTRQYHHIVWETPEKLRRDLAERIRARFG
ncbi:MAG: cadherin repeat domain-containing protein [Gemmatimonadota bacterium]|nr:cadherin repeat domain-containing protein [Gemmatimonadota bacterium]